jgi:hypothetical protein
MPLQTNSSGPDLQALSVQADNALMAKANSSLSRATTGPLGLSWFSWFKLTAVSGLLLYTLAHAGGLKRQVFGVSGATKQFEAQAILKSARAAVEQHRKETGSWPERVPLAALDALVNMKRTGNDYQLSIDLDGKIWVMDQNGLTTGE